MSENKVPVDYSKFIPSEKFILCCSKVPKMSDMDAVENKESKERVKKLLLQFQRYTSIIKHLKTTNKNNSQ